MLAKNQESMIYPIAWLVDGWSREEGRGQLISSGDRYVCDLRASAPADI